jgi:hypothetical protein
MLHPPSESKNKPRKKPAEANVKGFNMFIQQRITIAIHLTHSIWWSQIIIIPFTIEEIYGGLHSSAM